MSDRELYVTAQDGVRIHYRVEGQGTPLILQHGFTASSQAWYRFGYVEALREKFRLILVDARGHGLSDKPHEVAAHTMEKGAGDVIAVLDQLGLANASIWGFSMGGRIAFEMARAWSDRVRTMIVGGMSAETPSGRHKAFLERRAAALEMNQSSSLSPPDVRNADLGQMAEENRRLLRNDPLALVASTRALFLWPGADDALRRMNMPALIYCGDLDPVYPRARANAAALPNARFVTLPGLNHVESMRRSDLVLPPVRSFLAGQ